VRPSPRSRARTAFAVILVASAMACSLEPRADAQPPASLVVTEDSVSTRPTHRVVRPEGLSTNPLFSPAVQSGNLLFLSGQLGTLPGMTPAQLVEGGVQAEASQALENIRAILSTEGLVMEDLVKCTVFLADIADYAAVNEVYATFFPVDPPARSALGASGLALGGEVEIECIAAYPPLPR